MTPSDYAAWWGAALATIVLLWDIYKWKAEGPKLRGKANPNMQVYDTATKESDGDFLFVEVTNRGTASTTITSFCLFHFPNLFCRLFRLKKRSFFVPTPYGGPGVPCEMAPGDRWTGSIRQAEIQEWLYSGYLYAAIFHTWSDNPLVIKVNRPAKIIEV